MGSLNKCQIIGHLGRDVEIRYQPSGDAIANMAVATSFKSKDRNTGEQVEKTEWHRVALFGKLAELAAQYLRKGSSVYVEGRLQTRKYTDKDGVEKYATEIVADQLQFLDKRDAEPQQRQAAPSERAPTREEAQNRQRPAPNRAAPAPGPGASGFDDLEIPF